MMALIRAARAVDAFGPTTGSMHRDPAVERGVEFRFAGSLSGGDEAWTLTFWRWEVDGSPFSGTLLVRLPRLKALLAPSVAASAPPGPSLALPAGTRLVADTSPLLPEVPRASDADRAAVAEALGQGTLFS